MSQENRGMPSREHQAVVSCRLTTSRKFKIQRFRERNPSNMGSIEWIEGLFHFMQEDPNVRIVDVHRWVAKHKWILAPVDQDTVGQSRTRSNSNVFGVPNHHQQDQQDQQDHRRNNQNEFFVDSNLNTMNNSMFHNIPGPGFSLGFIQNVPSTSTSQPHFSPIDNSIGNVNTQTPPVQENFEIPKPKSEEKDESGTNCNLLCTMLSFGKDLVKMKHIENYRELVKDWGKLYDNVNKSVKSSIFPKKVKAELVTIEDDEDENEEDPLHL